MRYIFIILTLLLAGCSKPDPNPELKDPIYLDLNTQYAEMTKAVSEQEKKLAEANKTLNEATPQTGQNKYALKRFFEAESKLTKMRQEKQWLELRAAERKQFTKKAYATAYREKSEWPNPAEFERYKLEMKLRLAKRTWDVKDRIKELNPEKPKGKEGEGGEKKGH